MSSDSDLKKLFDEKNKQILENKLILDIANNTDSLKMIYHNIIWLEMNKLRNSLLKLRTEGKVVYEDREFDLLVEKQKEQLEDISLDGLSKRQEVLEFIIKGGKGNEKEATVNMINKTNDSVRKSFVVFFLHELLSIGRVKNEEDLTRINSLIRLTSNNIQSRIEKNTMTRLVNLENIMEDSRKTSKNISKVAEDTITNIGKDLSLEYGKKTLKKVA